MEDLKRQLKELQIQNKKLKRENERLQTVEKMDSIEKNLLKEKISVKFAIIPNY